MISQAMETSLLLSYKGTSLSNSLEIDCTTRDSGLKNCEESQASLSSKL